MTLSGEGDKTTGTVVTDLAITGKPAQFGRGMISDVSGKIIEQFAGCLSTKLGPEVAEPVASQPDTDGVAAAVPQRADPQQPEALDLMEYARGSVLQRVLPVVGAIVLGAVVFAIVRRLRRR